MKRPFHQPVRVGKYVYTRDGPECYEFRFERRRYLKVIRYGTSPTGTRLWPYQLFEVSDPAMRKPTKVDLPGRASTPYCTAGKGWEKFPQLSEFLCNREYEDGSARKPGWMSFSADNGVVRWLLKDGTAGLLLRGEAQSLERLLSTIESVLAMSVVPWEDDPRAEKPKSRRKS